ncbi:MAG TPA: amino acid racemase [Terriglobales bacterium]|nr:amino acid racemase [Terriglobales bacterium]
MLFQAAGTNLTLLALFMMKHIGIVACSAEGAALCYRTIALEGAQLIGPHDHPEVTLHNHSLAEYMKFIARDDWNSVAELLLSSATKLAKAGADFLICPDNTIHQSLPLMRDRSPLPWLHIAEVVAEAAVHRGFRKLAITGTKYLVNSNVYPDALGGRGLGFVRPTPGEREEINRIIMDELVYGIFKPEAVSYFQHVIDALKSQGCDAVVLGCTEIPLLMNDGNSPLPTLDSTRLLARAAVRYAIG